LLAISTYDLSLHLPSGLRFLVLRSCCNRCAPFTTAVSILYSRLPIGLDPFDFITDFEASTPIVSFGAGHPYVYGQYRRLAISFVNFAFDTGCHLSHRLFVRMQAPFGVRSSCCCGCCASTDRFDGVRFAPLSGCSFGIHKVSLALSSIIAFAILRNYDCLTDAFRIAFANCATLSNAFSILFGCVRSPAISPASLR
jgi:hypothetical protein